MERGAISQLIADRAGGRLVRLRYGSAEISFNARDVAGGLFEHLQLGQLVDFEIATDLRRGLRALNVCIVEDGVVLRNPIPQGEGARAISSHWTVNSPETEAR
jgi:cold shock CspA family protein